MIVVLDGTPLSLSSGGLRRYTEELARHLRLDTDWTVEVLPSTGRLWWPVRLPMRLARLRAAVFHGTNFEVPYIPVCPTVLTLHDLSPWKDTGWHTGAERVRRRTPALLRLGLATTVITPSEAVRKEAIERFLLPPSRVVAVPEAAAGHLRSTGAATGNYFLFVGTVEPRKNLPILLSAWQSIRQRHNVELVIAGRHRADAPSLPEQPGLTILGEVSEDSLADLYSRSIAVVYPSLYEGFGLPVLEAMQCGVPVITTYDAALLEISGGAAIHVSGSRQLEAAMETLLLQPDERLRRCEMSQRRASEFSWERTAKLTSEVYGEAIQRWRF